VTEEKDKDVWDEIAESVTENNKEDIVAQLEKAVEFLANGGDKDLLAKFKAVIKKIK
jgi:hypothetical protein